MTEFQCPICNAILTVKVKNEAAKKMSVEDVKQLFPNDLENLLTFEEKEGYIKIKPRQFLGKEIFSNVAAIVKAASGEYVSAGKESHFRIQKKA